MANDPRGTIVQQGFLLRINNALVEEVRCSSDSNGYLVVSYAAPGGNQTVSIQNIRLNVSGSTVILSSLGQRIGLCQIQSGMWVNAVFSSRMTRSVPPQSAAYLVTVQRNAPLPIPPMPPILPQPPCPSCIPRPPQPSPSTVTTGRILTVDFNGRYITVLDSNNRNSLIRFNVTGSTAFINRFGIPVPFRSLQPGQTVRVTHAAVQTFSIPPQSAAYQVQLI